MSDLSTTYLGLNLPSPIVAASSPLTADPEQVKQMEAAGIGAVVLPSLFEEQLMIDRLGMTKWAKEDHSLLPGELRHFPDMDVHNKGVTRYLTLIHTLKGVVDVPIIASLNGHSLGGWVEYASLLTGAGADALELNLYDVPVRPYPAGADLIANYRSIVSAVAEKVSVPVAVKIGPFFASIPNVVMQFVEAGAKGMVLFNRFYQPDIDLDTEKLNSKVSLSHPDELRLRLRWTGILYDRFDTDIAITGGVYTYEDVARSILVGAKVVTIASAVMTSGAGVVAEMNVGLSEWMDRKGYGQLKRFRGKLSQSRLGPGSGLTRANYIRTLGAFKEDADSDD